MNEHDQQHFAEQRKQRVRVQAPSDAPIAPTTGLKEQSAENFYVRQLVRSQLRLAISVASGVLVLLLGFAALVMAGSSMEQITLLGIPLSWWVLGVGMYPLIIVAGLLYTWSAVRNERRYRSIAK